MACMEKFELPTAYVSHFAPMQGHTELNLAKFLHAFCSQNASLSLGCILFSQIIALQQFTAHSIYITILSNFTQLYKLYACQATNATT